MNDNPDKKKTEEAALDDRELEQASGGAVYHPSTPIYMFYCEACKVWLYKATYSTLVHNSCGQQMKCITGTQEKNSIKNSPEYRKIGLSETTQQ